MAGPLLERVRSRLGDDDDESIAEQLSGSPLLDEHTDKLEEKLRSKGGGCCNAATVAQAVREEGQKYK